VKRDARRRVPRQPPSLLCISSGPSLNTECITYGPRDAHQCFTSSGSAVRLPVSGQSRTSNCERLYRSGAGALTAVYFDSWRSNSIKLHSVCYAYLESIT